MDWFLYDRELLHERVNSRCNIVLVLFTSLRMFALLCDMQ